MEEEAAVTVKSDDRLVTISISGLPSAARELVRSCAPIRSPTAFIKHHAQLLWFLASSQCQPCFRRSKILLNHLRPPPPSSATDEELAEDSEHIDVDEEEEETVERPEVLGMPSVNLLLEYAKWLEMFILKSLGIPPLEWSTSIALVRRMATALNAKDELLADATTPHIILYRGSMLISQLRDTAARLLEHLDLYISVAGYNSEPLRVLFTRLQLAARLVANLPTVDEEVCIQIE